MPVGGGGGGLKKEENMKEKGRARNKKMDVTGENIFKEKKAKAKRVGKN
jgi:hypothetical protein